MYCKIILVIAVCVLAADALKCNLCAGSTKSDCANNVTTSMLSQTCHTRGRHTQRANFASAAMTTMAPPAGSGAATTEATASNTTETPETESSEKHHKLDTYCVSFSTTDGKYLSSGIEKGCGFIMPGVDICKYLKKHLPEVDDCSACQTDFCN